jgi:glucose/arabinose dehydrogenase
MQIRPLRLSLFLSIALLAPAAADRAMALPANFTESVAFSGLTLPVAVRFSPDGRVFVAEKSGNIKVFDNLSDTTSTMVVGPGAAYNLQPNVHDYWDRGLLGFALHPNFPATPYIYVLYTYDYDPLDPSRPAPRWGDTCPDKDGSNNIIGPGATDDGCVVNGRISRFQVGPDNVPVGGETVILENNWCQQYPSHSIGSLVFGTEGALYVTAGDGSSFTTEDWGQDFTPTPVRIDPNTGQRYTPINPCADPNAPRGTGTTKPSAGGGALRAQDVRTLGAGDPVTFDGAVLRINPDTGAAWPDNPLVGGATSEDDRIIAYGLRNPFRATRRPGTNELWIGDVGWDTWEEIDRIPSPTDATVENFGWPCVEGPDRPAGYNNNLSLCTSLATSSTTPAHFAFKHGLGVYSGDPCSTTSGSSVSGLAFYSGGTYPAPWNGALFFADHSRNCVFVMTAGAGGLPDPATTTVFDSHVVNPQQVGDPDPVDLVIGPGGDLFIVDYDDGNIRRIRYNVGNNPPTANLQATPSNGPAPLQVQFDGTGSTDPDPGTTLFYAWDLDGDGQYDDAFVARPVWTYTHVGNVTVRLRVTDDDNATATATTVISVGNSPPTATILSPASSLTWHVGEVIPFSGAGTDASDGTLPATAFHWDVVLHHCPGGPEGCHEHGVESFDGVKSGSYTAPDHEYYSYLEFRLTVTDSGGLADGDSVSVDPEAVTNSFSSTPSGLTFSVAGFDGTTPFTRPAIVDSTNSLVAVTPQAGYYFVSWDDGGDSGRTFMATAAPQSFHAAFATCVAVETTCDGLDNDCDGTIDDVAIPGAVLGDAIGTNTFSWSALPAAASYDVVRGHLNALGGGTPFSSARTDLCVAAATPLLQAGAGADPAPGALFWYVVRGRSCSGAGTYDSGAPGQIGSRDPGINAAAGACPP